MTKDMWVIRRAYRFEDLKRSGPFAGIESKVTVEGPQMFLPVFETRKDAEQWTKPHDAVCLMLVAIDNPTP